VSEQPSSVSADDLRPPSPRVAAWQDAVARAERGETVAVVAHGEHVADVVPSGELDRLRETIEVLSDHELVRALGDREPVVHGLDAIEELIAQRVDRERS
jgi:antitoxin (DNA-binding transcriptional repressor) of toxin-antitoxin stability system